MVGATFLVYLLNIWALQYVNASVVGIYIYLQPFIATAFAVAFRSDELELITVLYALVIMIGVFMVSRK